MSLFVQQHNGKVRRVRGTIGGSSAWKQHDDNSGWDDPSSRRRLIEKIQDNLAMEQVRDALAGGDCNASPRNQRHSRRHDSNNRRPQSVSAGHHQAASTTARPVVDEASPRPRFKAVISESGKIVAVRIS